MGGLKAKRGKWSYQLDFIYFKIEDDESALESIPFGLRDRHSLDVGLDADVTIEAWVVTPTVGFNLVDAQQGSLDVIGGARYLNIDVPCRSGNDRRSRLPNPIRYPLGTTGGTPSWA